MVSGGNIGVTHRSDHSLGEARRAGAAAEIRGMGAGADGPCNAVLEELRGDAACRLTRLLIQPIQ